MKALVADDDMMTRHLVLQTLGHTDLDIQCAENGADAWERLNVQDPPRLLILDWLMPQVNGLEICQRIRERKDPDHTYIILLTVRGKKVDILTAMDAGVDDYIIKPIDRDELLAKVRLARKALEREEHLTAIIHGWRAMLDHLPFGVACLGRDGELLRANKTFSETLGLDIKEMLGKSLMPLMLRRSADIGQLRNSIRRSQPFDRAEMEIVIKNSPPRRLYVWGRPVVNSGPLVYQIIMTVE